MGFNTQILLEITAFPGLLIAKGAVIFVAGLDCNTEITGRFSDLRYSELAGYGYYQVSFVLYGGEFYRLLNLRSAILSSTGAILSSLVELCGVM
jgi:hypothetical protein